MNSRAVIVAVLVALAAGVGGFFIGRASKSGGEKAAEEPKEKVVASVKVVLLKRTMFATKTIAYGTVSALPERLVVLSSQSDGTVDKLNVALGQQVNKGDVVAEVTPAPETMLAVKETAQVAESAEKDLKLVQQRYDMKLATSQELGVAQAALRAANLKKESFEQRHAGERGELKATEAGVVAKIDLQQGQAAGAGAGIVEILPSGKAVARVGVDVAQAGQVHAGQKATVAATAGKSEVDGTVQIVAQRINPDSKLIDVLIALPAESALPLDTAVRAEIQLGQKEGLLVPRDAALPAEEGKFELFTVKDGKAIKHEVKVEQQTEDQVEVSGEDLKERDQVVIQGNYQLEDGMQVTVGATAAATQPTTQPATKEAP